MLICQNEPSHAFVYCESSYGERTVARTLDKTLLEQMMREEFVGKKVQIDADKIFTPIQ